MHKAHYFLAGLYFCYLQRPQDEDDLNPIQFSEGFN